MKGTTQTWAAGSVGLMRSFFASPGPDQGDNRRRPRTRSVSRIQSQSRAGEGNGRGARSLGSASCSFRYSPSYLANRIQDDAPDRRRSPAGAARHRAVVAVFDTIEMPEVHAFLDALFDVRVHRGIDSWRARWVID